MSRLPSARPDPHPSAGSARASPSASRWVSQAVVIVICQLAISSVKLLAEDRARDLVGRALAVAQRVADRGQVARDQLAVGLDVPADVGERPRVAGEREPGVERVDDVQRVQELADRVRRVADVEVLRDAPEQVVAGDQQRAARAGAGRRARARGRASRSRPRCRRRSRSSRPGPGRGRCAACPPGRSRGRGGARPSAGAAPRGRRSGARPRSCGRGPAGARRAASSAGASRPRSRRARPAAAPARSGRCARA